MRAEIAARRLAYRDTHVRPSRGALTANVPVREPIGPAVKGSMLMTIGTRQKPGRRVSIECYEAGEVTFVNARGFLETVTVQPGLREVEISATALYAATCRVVCYNMW